MLLSRKVPTTVGGRSGKGKRSDRGPGPLNEPSKGKQHRRVGKALLRVLGYRRLTAAHFNNLFVQGGITSRTLHLPLRLNVSVIEASVGGIESWIDFVAPGKELKAEKRIPATPTKLK